MMGADEIRQNIMQFIDSIGESANRPLDPCPVPAALWDRAIAIDPHYFDGEMGKLYFRQGMMPA